MDVFNDDMGANKLELYSIDEAFIDVGGISTGSIYWPVTDEINYRYGRDIIRSAAIEDKGDWQGKSEHRQRRLIRSDTLGSGQTFSRAVRFL